MKSLSSLTTFFVAFLFVVYSGVFAGLKINGFIAGKKLVSAADTLPPVLVSAQPAPKIEPTPQASAAKLAQVTKNQQKQVYRQTAAPQTASAGEPAPSQQSQVLPAVSEQPQQTTAPAVAAANIDASAPTPAPVTTSAPVSTPVATAVPTEPPPPPPSNRCIIAISGSNYDVTEYRNIHSGGDVFACGTDMTASFTSQHPASFLQRMAQYKV